MAFKLGDLLIDRLQFGYAATANADRTPLYILTQLSEATIETSSDPTEIKDALGNVVKTIYHSKSGTFTATNAFVNGNLIATTSGSNPVYATESAKITMPRLIAVKGTDTTVNVPGLVAGTLRVTELTGDGAMGVHFTQASAGDSADATHFTVAGEVVTLPVGANVAQFLVIYEREVSDGVKVTNSADKFPETTYMLFKGLYYDPCDQTSVKSLYIEVPSFQVSPDVSIGIQAETTMDITGQLQLSYCDADKVLYNVYFVDDEETV